MCSIVFDDAPFHDGNIMAGVCSVPMAPKMWLGMIPLMVALPAIAIDSEHVPIAARLFNAMSAKPAIPKSDSLVTTYVHFQALHKMIGSVFEDDTQALCAAAMRQCIYVSSQVMCMSAMNMAAFLSAKQMELCSPMYSTMGF